MNLRELLGDKYADGMSFEDIELALMEVEIPQDNSSELERLRNALSKSNSEAANYKKQLREKMTEDELKKAKEEDERKALEDKYNELLSKVQLSEYKAKYLALGYEEALAADTAQAMLNNDIEKIFENQKAHIAAVASKAKEDLMKGTPKPQELGNGTPITKEELRKMSAADRHKFSVENPEAYKQIYGGN